MTERVISEKIVKKPNILTNNPIINKLKDIASSIKNVFLGMLLVLLGLGVIVISVRGVREDSKTVASLEMISPNELSNKSGMIKLKGKISVDNPLVYSFNTCADIGCYMPFDTKTYDNILYLKVKYERLEPVEKTETETRTIVKDGQEVEQTIEKKYWEEEWVTKKEEDAWATFKIGGVDIKNPSSARLYANMQTVNFDNVYLSGLGTVTRPVGETFSSDLGRVRLTMSYIPVDTNLDWIVVGNINNGAIMGGEPFILTDKDEQTLVNDLASSEKTSRRIIKIVAWLLLTIGFTLMVGPILEVLEIVPVLGSLTKWIIILVFAIISAIIVVIGSVIVKFWYIFIILLLGSLVWAVKAIASKRSNKIDNGGNKTVKKTKRVKTASPKTAKTTVKKTKKA